MKIKKEKGLAGVDIIIAIIAITIFSTLIVSLMYNNVIENVKLKRETLATIYLTETFENIGIESYENITEENINNLVPQEARDSYQVEMTVTSDFANVDNNENIMKKVVVKMSYVVGNKSYSCSMQRMKIKE